ncbi:hypothetical protein SAMD00019534_117270 [Acytostelium subglobosum LB1]|uniref:hypothetical protein n=1 Tax=Acytostelium subglobosum LB1 TaxID=1410327 RepID=UPI0006449287|nr:hypothetical protein SAMD00019534_117270 [Acytostelium subglobosum LB1]GAM28551.1 hypothetical protein SAMD00019534_117270 [Acytostelium subglobosum LB1]|eukprot:XP_012748590.1 hypothetical protein SAMD00019534_117270 [Acytostelium subglobosum LB1]
MTRSTQEQEYSPLLSKYSKSTRDLIIIYLLSFMILLTLVAIGMTTFLNLLPSIKLGKEFIETSCLVKEHEINITQHYMGQECIKLNREIWWYPLLGQNSFYHNVVQHGNTSDSADDWEGYNNDGMDGEGSGVGITCYQGLFVVEYQLDAAYNNVLVHSNISGTWNSRLRWVDDYLVAFKV